MTERRLSEMCPQAHRPGATALGARPQSSRACRSILPRMACSCGRDVTVTSTCPTRPVPLRADKPQDAGPPTGVRKACLKVCHRQCPSAHQVGRPVHQRRHVQHQHVGGLGV